MKAIVRTLLVLLVVSTGFAWATDEPIPVPTPQIEQPEQIEPEAVEPEAETEELTVQDLEAMNPDAVDADACCIANCWTDFEDCMNECMDAGNPYSTCNPVCAAERRSCIRGC